MYQGSEVKNDVNEAALAGSIEPATLQRFKSLQTRENKTKLGNDQTKVTHLVECIVVVVVMNLYYFGSCIQNKSLQSESKYT